MFLNDKSSNLNDTVTTVLKYVVRCLNVTNVTKF